MARGVRRRTPTPRGKAPTTEEKPLKVNAVDEGYVNPYALMDRRDEKQIDAGITGQEIGDLLYLIPFGVKEDEYGKVDWGEGFHKVCSYCRNKKKKHTHVVGVSVQGIDEISRIYGGIQRVPLENNRVHRDGRYWWIAKAAALDVYTDNGAMATAEQPCTMRRGGPEDARADLDRVIAERKAERNAVRKILPQFFLRKLESMAREGRRTFEQKDVERLVKSLGEDRSRKVAKSSLIPGMVPLNAGKLITLPLLTGGEPPEEGAEPPAEEPEGTKPPATTEAKADPPKPAPATPANQGEINRRRLTAWKKREGIEIPDEQLDAWWTAKFQKKPEDMNSEEMDAAGKELIAAYEGFGKTPEERRRTFVDLCVYEADQAATEAKGDPGELPLG